MTSVDPLAVVRCSLDRVGCGPHGAPHDFRSRCPAHDGDGRDSLHISEGADGHVLLHCFARGCAAEDIAAAIGLRVADLFPPGHRRARRRPLAPVGLPDFTGRAHGFGAVLAALERTASPWTALLSFDCPACGRAGAWLRSVPGDREPVADCPGGCRTPQIATALAARVAEVSS